METRGEFFCISGPDKGKRLALGERSVLLGTSASCGLLSDDEDLGPERVKLKVVDGRLTFRASANARVYVDGVHTPEGSLKPGRQLRAGRSVWQFDLERQAEARRPAPRDAGGLFGQAWRFINSSIGLEHPEGLNVKEVFSQVSQKRPEADVTELFAIGTSKNTPELMEIDTNWPKPWVFFKALVLTVMVYVGFVFAFRQFENNNLLPGLIMVGASAIPITVVIFYFEMNAPRNVSLHQVIRMLLIGGVASLITSLFGFEMVGKSLNWLGASRAGIVEETGKLLALLIIVYKTKYRWTLNGLLFGGAVGAGFAAFESAGYAFRDGMDLYSFGVVDLDSILDSILVRGLLTPGGHVAWTALVGAALWKVRGDQPFTFSMLKDERFLRVFALAMALHMIWNSPFQLPYYGKYVALIAVAWMAIFGFIQDGLNQIRREQGQAAAAFRGRPREKAAAAR
ncbi:MAG TPA: PrsW family glutamic-type intramembrane protease [Blastocatellia bacterium]|nr:PrsW family glutamic-type intramembrane protease [Blastocatellia bacterium]